MINVVIIRFAILFLLTDRLTDYHAFLGVKRNGSDVMLINSMHSWSRENPNGNILLIADDSDYVKTLKFMEEGGHKVMIAGGCDASELLMEHGQVWWNWPNIVLSDSGSSPLYYRNPVSFISI